MNNMEQAMRKAVAALTGKKEPEVPAGSMEQICEFLAEHYKAPSGPAFTQVQAPVRRRRKPSMTPWCRS